MDLEHSKLTFNVDRKMFEFFCIASFLNEQLDVLEKDSEDYEVVQNEYEKYKQLFVEQFRLINKEGIEQYQRISEQD